MTPTHISGEARERTLARLELTELRDAVRWLARERRQPVLGRIDRTTAAALTELARLVNGGEDAHADPLSCDHPQTGHRYLVLAKLARYPALKTYGGPRLAAALLESVRERLLAVSPQARVGRVGQGIVEFAFDLPGDRDLEVEMTALHDALEHPFVVDNEEYISAVVLGAAVAAEGIPLSEAVGNAEEALARAEGQGVKFALFSERERVKASERLALMRDLRAALRGDELTVAYQPKLNLRTGKVDSAEALVRWTHPVRGAVGPDLFIELAEDTGDIKAITEHVLTQAVRDQATLRVGGAPPAISVNISARLVADEGFCRRALAICADAAGKICVEITETSVIADPERALRNLHAFVDAGVGVSIDDYGSGLSSLAYLKTLPASELKIDKAFVLGLTTSHRDPLIVRSTIDLAHALDMEVTAEGVDDPTALALLQVMGCDRVQGFHISRPLALAALQAFLDDGAGHDLMPKSGAGLLGLVARA